MLARGMCDDLQELNASHHHLDRFARRKVEGLAALTIHKRRSSRINELRAARKLVAASSGNSP
jgi:hypothetical protein